SGSPSGSADPRPSRMSGTPAKAVYGPPAFASGARLVFVTVIFVIAEPERTFVAVIVTGYGVVRASMYVGVQVKVPAEFRPLAVKAALLPSGRPAKLAVRLVTAGPSGSLAVTVKERTAPSPPVTFLGAFTTGG